MRAMDVLPLPFEQLTETRCSGRMRRCAGGDKACRKSATDDGYVAISTYLYCREEDVHTDLTRDGIILIVVLLAAVVAGAWFAWRKVRRARS
jgi:hypothetical protein